MYKIRFAGADELTWDQFSDVAAKHSAGTTSESQVLVAHRTIKKPNTVTHNEFAARGWYSSQADLARTWAQKCDDAVKFAKELTPTINPEHKDGDPT